MLTPAEIQITERQMAKYERQAAAATDEHIANVIADLTGHRVGIDQQRRRSAYQAEADRRLGRCP